MANPFQSMNTTMATLSPDAYGAHIEASTPTTPRPMLAPNNSQPMSARMDDATTPTRASFGAMANQRPLPVNQSFPAAVTMPESKPADGALHRGDSQYSAKSRDSDDVAMGNSGDEDDGSDEESINADGTRTKKKKSQRFYCTDYPPCNLNFTRSEHLARHIRKHTGERPFQCHCSRRFSRLDNLRQHAQTVHVNEDIPMDSLAASGTRFQRQIRTERVRPPGGRSRAGTVGSIGPSRGHQRNSLSASSINSMQSYQSPMDRRRPAQLQMAGTQRNSGEYIRPDSPSYHHGTYSPGGYTPASAAFSPGPSSPGYGSAMQSPNSSHSRTQSLYNDHRTPDRRKSVPGNPFIQSTPGSSFGAQPQFGHNFNSGPYSPAGSMLESPTTPSSSAFSRRESISSAREDEMRRRTWHPDTHHYYQPWNSRLQHLTTTTNHYSNGPPPQVPVLPSNAPPINSGMRLPGIASFDPPRDRSQTPVRREPSPMMVDSSSRVPMRPSEPYRDDRPSSQQWDMGMNRNMDRLDIAHNTSSMDNASSWASETTRAVQAQAEHVGRQHPVPGPPQNQVRFEESPYTARSQQQYHHQSDPPVTPRGAKRMGWFNGPMSPTGPGVQYHAIDPRLQRPSPEDSSSSENMPGTPSSATAAAEYNPLIVHSNGYVENRGMMPTHEVRVVPSNAPAGYPVYQHQAPNNADGAYTHTNGGLPQQSPLQSLPKDQDNLRLDTLVAAAASMESNRVF